MRRFHGYGNDEREELTMEEVRRHYRLHHRFKQGYVQPHPLVTATKCEDNRHLVRQLRWTAKRKRGFNEELRRLAEAVATEEEQVHPGNLDVVFPNIGAQLRDCLITSLLGIYEDTRIERSRVPRLRRDKLPCFAKWPHPFPGLCPSCVHVNGERIKTTNQYDGLNSRQTPKKTKLSKMKKEEQDEEIARIARQIRQEKARAKMKMETKAKKEVVEVEEPRCSPWPRVEPIKVEERKNGLKLPLRKRKANEEPFVVTSSSSFSSSFSSSSSNESRTAFHSSDAGSYLGEVEVIDLT